MQKFITNAFSLNMLTVLSANITVKEVSLTRAQALMGFHALESAVGHADTAAVFQAALGLPVPCNRATVRLNPGDWILVGQYSGPRLEEGATTLPPGAAIKWAVVDIHA